MAADLGEPETLGELTDKFGIEHIQKHSALADASASLQFYDMIRGSTKTINDQQQTISEKDKTISEQDKAMSGYEKTIGGQSKEIGKLKKTVSSQSN